MSEVKIKIDFGSVGFVEGVLSDSVNPKTFKAIIEKIPFESDASTWGKEVYFDTPASSSVENGKRQVEVGDIGFWPPGNAMCLFFGPTPSSRGSEPVAASPVNVIGKITRNLELLSRIIGGTKIKVGLLE